MKWQDKIKNALFEEEVSQETSTEQRPKVVSSSPSVPESNSSSEVEINSALLDKIEEKIKNSDLPGPDYLELKGAAEENSLVQEEPDEGKRWRQAYRNMKAFFPNSGITKEKIIQAIDHYISIVDGESALGLQELEDVRSRDITKELEASEALGREIELLESQIAEKKKLKEEKDSLISANKSKYDLQEQVFKKTIDHAREVLKSDKTKISNYIND